MDTPDSRLAFAGQVQAGAFTRTQALAAGVKPSQIRFRLAQGLWSVIHPGVYCAATTARRRETRAVAGLLYCGERARFSHLTAARLAGIDVPIWSDDVWITIPHEQYARRRPGLVVTRSRHIPRDVTHTYGQPVMPPSRTIVDLAQVLDRSQLRGVLYDVVRRGVLTVDQVMAEAEGLGGRAGLSMLRDVLEEFDVAFDSVLEAEADHQFVAAGLPLERQVEIRDGWELLARVDFADRERRLAIEIDGERYHSQRAARGRDRRRDRALRARGWEVVRFDADDVRREPAKMVREVRAIIRRLDVEQLRSVS